MVFLGASYFRAVAKGEGYGLCPPAHSGIKTADPGGEEFPAFKAFWLERPQSGTNSLVVWALVDSPSAAAAVRFTVRPGETTVVDVELTLYPAHGPSIRRGSAAWPACFSSIAMGRTGRRRFPPRRARQRRPHDVDRTRRAAVAARSPTPVRSRSAPSSTRPPAASDSCSAPGTFSHYQDLEARYERRPSLWIEPIGDWGEGMVQLVEIPTKSEIHDNIVAYWRPKQKLGAG